MFRVPSSQDNLSSLLDSRTIPLRPIDESPRVTRARSQSEASEVIDYLDLYKYFQKYKDYPEIEESVFKKAFHDGEVENTISALEREFSPGFFNQPLNKRDQRKGYPLIAYALAGNWSPLKWKWLLRKLNSSDLQSYESCCPLINIVVIFGCKEKLKALIDASSPKETALTNGLLLAAYYGKLEMFNLLETTINHSRSQKGKSEIVLNNIKDEDGNTLLHLTVIGKQASMLQRLISISIETVRMENKKRRQPIDEALFSGDIDFFEEILRIYNENRISENVTRLIDIIVKNDFSGQNKSMLYHLLKEGLTGSDYTRKLDRILRSAIDSGNSVIIEEFVGKVLLTTGTEVLNSLLEYAESKHRIAGKNSQKECLNTIISLINREVVFRLWVSEIQRNLIAHLHAYIFRQNNLARLKALAEEDGVENYLAPEVLQLRIITGALSKEDKLQYCTESVNRLLYFNNNNSLRLREFYARISESQRRDASIFLKYFRVIRRDLIACFKQPANIDYETFEKKLISALTNAFESMIEEKTVRFPVISGASLTIIPTAINRASLHTSATSNYQPVFENHAAAPSWTDKQEEFIEKFANEFDAAHRFYMCISTGQAVRPRDGIDELAEAGRRFSAFIPNVSVSAAATGLPLPMTFTLPSSVVVAAMIDLSLMIREYVFKQQARQISYFFNGTLLRDRTEMIYHFAYSVAREWSDQISLLHIDSVRKLAELAVARMIRHLSVRGNIISSSASSIGALTRKVASFIIDVGPEPEIHLRCIDSIANNAMSVREHLVMRRNQEEESKLRLADPHNDISQANHNKYWTAKGIFEHTGVRTLTGATYASSGQDVGKYGYRKITTEETNGMAPTDIVPWFEQNQRQPMQGQGHFQIFQQHARGSALSAIRERGGLDKTYK